MATFTAALQCVKQHLRELVPDQLIVQICRELGHSWRRRQLDPVSSVRLFLLQLLAGVALRGLRHVAGITVSAQAICAARMRLPLQLMVELVQRCVPADAICSTWHGMRVFIADGMSFMTQDSPELQKRFGKARNHKGTSHGYPAPKLLALLDLAGGFIHRVTVLPWHRQEFSCLSRLFKAVGERGLLLGDRGMVSFAHLALLLGEGIAGCFRLPAGQVVRVGGSRHGRRPGSKGPATRRCLKRLGRQDMLVAWRGERRPKWLSRQRWKTLADTQLTLRQIGFRIVRPGYRTHWAWIITTLTDPQQYPATELIELYSRRWQVEVYFRDLKRTLNMALISARTVQGTNKEVLAFVLLYNLTRNVMAQAAQRQQVSPDRISFTDALCWLLWASPGQQLPRLATNPRRQRPSPARCVKVARRRYPPLKGIRAQTCKPPCIAKL